MPFGFEKITPHNGFDSQDHDNAVQNNYAWAMSEMDDYLYVGTGRNIAYNYMKSGLVGKLNPTPSLTPRNIDNTPEIWRYKKDGSKEWERVYKAEPELKLEGIRFLIAYTSPSGEKALYAGGHSIKSNMIIIKSNDGETWRALDSQIDANTSTRSMIVYKEKLYLAAIDRGDFSNALLFSSSDPEMEPWQLVIQEGDPDKNPRGEITSMCSFQDHLYVGTANPGGFEVWRTEGDMPEQDKWKLVVDKGAGDALNEVPITMSVFRDSLYVGTAIALAVYSMNKEKHQIPPKGFDLVRINSNDTWNLIVGGPPLAPTEPKTGQRGYSLANYGSGFNTLTNAYCWQLQEYNNEFYLGTFDWSVFFLPGLSALTGINLDLSGIDINNLSNLLIFSFPWLRTPLNFILRTAGSSRYTMGFDLWKSYDGVNWAPVTVNGLGNNKNHGARTMLVSSDNKLYLGTANSFEGCEVWVYDGNGII